MSYEHIYCEGYENCEGYELRYDEIIKIKIEEGLFYYNVFIGDIYNHKKTICVSKYDDRKIFSYPLYSIKDIINNIRKMINLKELIIKDTITMIKNHNFIEIFKEIPYNLYNLEVLEIHKCNCIKEIPDTLIKLKQLIIFDCCYIKEIPNTLINIEDVKSDVNIKHINKSRRDDDIIIIDDDDDDF